MYNVISEDFKSGKDFKVKNFVDLGCRIVVGDNVFIDSYVAMSGDCVVGNDVIIRYRASIGRDVTIGNGVFIAPHVVILYQDHKRKGHKVEIGEHVFIGTGTVVNAGVKIAPTIVIGSMSTVTKDLLKPGAIYRGSPAKFIRYLSYAPACQFKTSKTKPRCKT